MPLFSIIDRWKSMVLACLLIQFIPFPGSGQTTVNGRVTDAESFEPVGFANVIFRGTAIGTKTDFEGKFNLSGNTESNSIIISFIGYETKVIGIKPGALQTVDVQLHPALYTLGEVKITPGENPAHLLLRKVWEHNPENGIERLSAYQYENYSRSTLFLRKFGSRSDNKGNLRPFAREFDKYSVNTGEEGIPALPSFITESRSEKFYLNSPKREYTRIIATSSDGIAFENTDLVAQLVTKEEDFYFPDNTVRIVDKSFISPLSRFGLLYYKYYIIDTAVLEGRYYCFEMRFIPKRDEDPVLRGSFWINDTTFALKRISVEADRKAELNFIQRIRIQQDYEPAATGAWFAVSTRFMADAVNIFVTNFSHKSNIVVNEPFDPGFYGSEMKIEPNSRNYGQDYWAQNRANSYDHIDSLAVMQIDTLKHVGKIRVSARLAEASIKGYYNFGRFELGPWIMMYSHNTVEGSRFRIGGRTNADFSKKMILEGYLAYGVNDRRLKGSVQSEFFLSREHWTQFGLQYRDDVENIGAIDEFYSGSAFLSFATSFGGSGFKTRSQLMRTWLESDIFKGMTGKLVFTFRKCAPARYGFFPAWYEDLSKTRLSTSLLTSEAGLILKYQPKAVYVIDGVRRFPVNFNKYPVLSLQYFRGYEDLFNGDYNYQKIVAGISQHFNIGGLGSLEYDLAFTKISGQLPYPLLITLAGNESVFRTSGTYNMMNYGEFILDEAVEIYASWHMNGLILNKIPLIRKLQWRTVVSGHSAFGSFNDEINGYYDPLINPRGILYKLPGSVPPYDFHTLSYSKPYIELSYGIENIFRFIRIDLVRRLTYLGNPDTHRLGVKISGVFRF